MSENTKDRILDTAERLFADHGFGATSIRHIVAEAGVNLAAIHYHFKSKDALLDAVILRNATPVNEERLAMLDRFEADSRGGAIPVERVLEAFLLPMLAVLDRNPVVLKLIGRMHSEGFMPRLMRTHFRHVVERFLAAFQKSLPDLPFDELSWRIQFTVGAMVATLNGFPELGESDRRAGGAQMLRRLITFLAAGFRASSTIVEENHEIRLSH